MVFNRLLQDRLPSASSSGLLVFLWSVSSAPAWGPHSEITQAALAVLGTNDALVVHLGAQAQKLTHYCWMGDYFGVVVEEPDMLFYADDYLLFPGAPKYFDHTGPEIQQTFRPFFNRALQALRTENPANAARWVGALVHFVQDAGCPSHAAGLRGDVHVRMEAWVETNQIHITEHRPTLLGTTDGQALQGLLQRLEETIPTAQQRGRRLRVPVEVGNRGSVKPVMLESALECARLTADLLHTLGQIQPAGPQRLANLQGTISSQPPVGMERFPAKVVLAGTSYSTLADLSGRFEFRNLSEGSCSVLAFRPGHGLLQTNLQLTAGETTVCNLALPRTSSNLVPNGEFQLSWIRPTAPDYWSQTKSGWEGQPILLKEGQRYRLAAQIKKGGDHVVVVRWTHRYEHAVPRFQIEPRFERKLLTAADPEMVFTGSPEFGLVQITIRGRKPPASVCERITLAPIPAED